MADKHLSLKVLSNIFLLFYSLILKDSKSFLETWKNNFYFTSKAISILEIFKYYFFRILHFKTSLNPMHETRNKFH